MDIEEEVALAPLTTFGIGGSARFFARVRSVEDLHEAQAFALDKGIPFYILGGGSNALVSDEGLPGLVVKIEIAGVIIEPNSEEIPQDNTTTPKESPRDSVLLEAGAGESWDGVVARAVEESLWGIENLSGIPGTVGGAVVQNIGAYGQALSEVLTSVEVWDRTTGELRTFYAAECAFDYRDSVFKHDQGRHVVVRATLRLSTTPAPNLSYRDLKNYFGARASVLADIRAAVLAIRKGKFPDLSVEGTAGSFFKNPMLPAAEARALAARYPGMPLFDMPETSAVKVPLAWLLDHVLNMKGMSLGNARLFERQPIVIAAGRGGSAADVVALAEAVRSRVREAFGFEIEEEVRIM